MRRSIPLLIAAALALGACGSSIHPRKTAAVTSNGAPTAASATAATSTPTPTTTATARPRRSRLRPAEHKPVAAAPASAVSLAAKTTTQASAPSAGVPHAAHVSGPTPNTCLRTSGLLEPHAVQTAEWQGLDPATKQPVFVQGPFKTARQADAYAQTYAGVNLVARGGLYVASANLSSHLDFWVKAVAKCLSQTAGTGVLKF